MSILGDIRTYIAGRSSVITLCGTRVYSLRGPVNTPVPYVIVEREGGEPDYSLLAETGSARVEIAVSCYGATATSAEEVAAAVRNALSGFRGQMGSTTATAPIITDSVLDYLPPEDGSDRGHYVETLRFEVGYVQALPTGL